MLRPSWTPILLFLALLARTAAADDFPELYNSESQRDAKPMPPQEAAQSMKAPAGFSVGVFASEPEVLNPIDMTWDARGRIWIAENFTYAERSKRFDLSLRDRVIILEDADSDGVADRRVVFTDQVQMLTGLEVGRGGVWLMCPPQLLFIPDADRDDRPDGPARVVLDGFEVAQQNYHNFANGLRWGPDGWLYGRCGGSCPGRVGLPGTPREERIALEGGIWRYSPSTGEFEVLTHGTTNPWGHDWDALGEGFFINTVNGHLWHLIPGAHFVRPFTLDPNPSVYELIDMHADHWHFDTKGSWTKSRGGAANKFGGGHAHTGMMIYLGDNWPQEYRGRLLTWNIHGRRANQEILERDGSGYVGRHGPDMLISGDPFFRGMELSYGPDGTVYAIDWSDTGECHEHTGVHRDSGRVFRVSHVRKQGGQNRAPKNLYAMSSVQLADLVTHANEWFPRQARIVLAERARAASPSGSEDLDQAAERLRRSLGHQDPAIVYRALTTLYAMECLEHDEVLEQLRHENEHIRAWAIRLLTDHWPLDDVFGPTSSHQKHAARVSLESGKLLGRLCAMAKSEASGLVRLTLASTLQRMPLQHRLPLADQLMRRSEDAQDHNLPLLVWYGLIPVAEAQPLGVARLAVKSHWPKTQRLIMRRLAERIDKAPEAVEAVLGELAESDDRAMRRNLLGGMSEGLKGWRRVPPPKNWPAVVKSVTRDGDAPTGEIVRELSVLFGDGRALAEVRRTVLDSSAEINLRRSALETLVATGGPELRELCLPLLNDARLNAVAIRGLAESDDPAVAKALIKSYRRFRAPKRPRVISLLSSRKSFASELLDAIASKAIPASDLTAFDVRQIRSLQDETLDRRVRDLWGELRDSPEAKSRQLNQLKAALNAESLAAADLSQGRQLFDKSCAKCHKLYGQGEAIGPDLTGGNRNNLDYLLENVVDPSAVVSKDFRMSVLATRDGRVLNGLVVSRNDKTLTLQTQTDLLTINLDDVHATRTTGQSPMPEGLLDNLSPTQIRDLIAYLMHPSQVPLPTSRSRSQ